MAGPLASPPRPSCLVGALAFLRTRATGCAVLNCREWGGGCWPRGIALAPTPAWLLGDVTDVSVVESIDTTDDGRDCHVLEPVGPEDVNL